MGHGRAQGEGRGGAITKRAPAGDAIDVAVTAVEGIALLKEQLESIDLNPVDRAALHNQIDELAKSAVEKSLRASDETHFHSGYEVRDEFIKTFYGTAERHAVLAPGQSIASARAALDTHFQGRPKVQERIAEAAALEASELPLTEAERTKLVALRTSIEEQFHYDKYTQDTLVRLAQDHVTYTEQSNSVKKLKERFDEGQLQWAKQRAKVEHPELAAQLDALEVKHIAMITTDHYGGRDGNVAYAKDDPRQMSSDAKFAEALADVEAMMARGDVVGMDVAGMEHFQFNEQTAVRFEATHAMLAKVSAARGGEPVVLRPHVGEGAIDTTVPDPFARDANRQVTPQGELTHYARARHNIDVLVASLETIAVRHGGSLPPSVVVRFGHATHATPAQAAKLQQLGVIVEVNLRSNQATGAVAQNKPVPGQPDERLGPDHVAPTYGQGQAKLPTLEDHSLATLIFHDVKVVLSTDGHDVMNTTLGDEFKAAADLLVDIKSGKMPIRISVEQAHTMNARGGRVDVPADAPNTRTIEVRYHELSKDKQDLFDQAYRKFYETAQRYVTSRPKQGGTP
jgi:hypothetical protein